MLSSLMKHEDCLSRPAWQTQHRKHCTCHEQLLTRSKNRSMMTSPHPKHNSPSSCESKQTIVNATAETIVSVTDIPVIRLAHKMVIPCGAPKEPQKTPLLPRDILFFDYIYIYIYIYKHVIIIIIIAVFK